MIFMGLFGLWTMRKSEYETRYRLVFVALTLMCVCPLRGTVPTASGRHERRRSGVGSTAFHGTLRLWAQFMDELPMLWGDGVRVMSLGARRPWLRVAGGGVRVLSLGACAARVLSLGACAARGSRWLVAQAMLYCVFENDYKVSKRWWLPAALVLGCAVCTAAYFWTFVHVVFLTGYAIGEGACSCLRALPWGGLPQRHAAGACRRHYGLGGK